MYRWNVSIGRLRVLLIVVIKDTVFLPGFDDEDVDGLLDMVCCD